MSSATFWLSLIIIAAVVLPYAFRYFKRKKHPDCPSGCIGCPHMKECEAQKNIE